MSRFLLSILAAFAFATVNIADKILLLRFLAGVFEVAYIYWYLKAIQDVGLYL